MSGQKGILWFVLDEESSEKLRQAVPPRYPNSYYHHVTLQHDVERSAVESWIGRRAAVTAYATAYSDAAQAVRVRTDLPDMYGVPHVTVSTAEGIKPFASVAMLQGEHEESPLDPPFSLTGTIEFEDLDNVKD
jgi:hypothetical protein